MLVKPVIILVGAGELGGRFLWQPQPSLYKRKPASGR